MTCHALNQVRPAHRQDISPSQRRATPSSQAACLLLCWQTLRHMFDERHAASWKCRWPVAAARGGPPLSMWRVGGYTVLIWAAGGVLPWLGT